MIPVVFSNAGGSYKIMKIASDDKVKKHLENLGIVKTGNVEVIQNNNGVIVLKVMESRVALNYDLASKIFVEWGIEKNDKIIKWLKSRRKLCSTKG